MPIASTTSATWRSMRSAPTIELSQALFALQTIALAASLCAALPGAGWWSSCNEFWRSNLIASFFFGSWLALSGAQALWIVAAAVAPGSAGALRAVAKLNLQGVAAWAGGAVLLAGGLEALSFARNGAGTTDALLVAFCALAAMVMNASLWGLAATAWRLAGRGPAEAACLPGSPAQGPMAASFAIASIIALAGGAQSVFPHAFDASWRAQAGLCARDREPMKSDWAAREAALEAREARAAGAAR